MDIKYHFAMFLLVPILLVSCEKRLDQVPISEATTETFYAIPNDFIIGVNAVYASLRGYPDRQLNLSETRSDNLYAVSDGGVRDWEGINGFQRSIANNPYVSEAWSSNFNGIFKANELLKQLEEHGEEVISDQDLRLRIEGEARFLRAFYYFDLVRWFGQVPLIEQVVTANEGLEIPRSDIKDVYDLILTDLEFAIENLPEQYAEEDLGRATKYAAEGVLALVYMTRSGPTYDIEGPGIDSDEWEEALSLLDDIITQGPFQSIDSYDDIYAYGNENNSEVIFDVEYSTGSDPIVGGTFPWVLVPDEWFRSQGENVQGGLTIRPISENLLNTYENGDVRKDFSVQSGYTTTDGIRETRSFFIKYVDLNYVPSDRMDWPINYIVLSLTDIKLLKAECILHSAPGSQQDVDDIVNQVRQRAGLGSINNVDIETLMNERRLEFAGEGKRWHDLVRNGMVIDKMADWIEEDDVQHQINPISENFIIYPVPQNQLDVNADLYKQNPGY